MNSDLVVGEESSKLRAHAEHCRWLAKSISDKQMVDALRQTARDFDNEAERIEAEGGPIEAEPAVSHID